MSEEMNLYKRCKNIFKAHGVDMGGGGSGGSGVSVVTFTADEDENIVADKTIDEICNLWATDIVIGVLYLGGGKFYQLYPAAIDPNLPVATFGTLVGESSGISYAGLEYDFDTNSWSLVNKEFE